MVKAAVPKSAGHKADPVTTICYGKADKWADRWEAVDFFTEGVYACEGSEQERYETILMKLIAGETVCSDEIN